MRSYRVSKSTSTSTSTATATTASVTVSGSSQPESAIERHRQGSFTGLPTTTVHTPESTHIPVTEQPFAGLRLLAEVSTSQADPFEAFATHRTITFDDEDQEQSAGSLSLPDEPSQAADDANPIMEVEEPCGLRSTVLPDNNSKDTKIKTTIGVPKSKIAPSIKEHFPRAMSGTVPETVQTGITEGPKLPSDQNLAIQDSDSTDKWIMYSGDKTRPFQCGYEGCGRTYTLKHNLKKHFTLHTRDSQFRCHSGNCAGAIKYLDSQTLARHIYREHTMERPFECNICNKRFGRASNLKRHQQSIHSTEKEQKSPPKRKRKVDPFEALATHRTITFDDGNQEQSASSLSLPDEPSQAADDANPNIDVEEPNGLRFTVLPDSISKDTKIKIKIGVPISKIAPLIKEHYRLAMLGTAPETVRTRITEDPKLPSDQNLAIQDSDSTDKWIMYSSDKTKPFKCGYEGCGKTFITKQVLQRHFVSHIGRAQFRCYTGDCTGAIRYCDIQALARHVHKKHTMERPHKCDICNKRFVYLHNLTSHRKIIHSVKYEKNQPQNPDSTDKWIVYSGNKTKLFQCGYEGCSRTYTEKKSLRRHFLSHTGDSQFRCYTGDCNGEMRYCDSQALARHIRYKHTMERPFKCNICNKRFVCRSNLKRHKQKMHSTEEERTTK